MKRHYSFSVQGGTRMRLDRYLLTHLPPSVSRSKLHRLFEAGEVRVNGRAGKPHRRVLAGETVELSFPEALTEKAPLLPEAIPLRIVFEDASLLVIDKPAGMVVHPAAGNWSGTLVHALLHHARSLSTLGGPFRPGIVHRLDKETSGLLVCAKDDLTHRFLSDQFEKKEVKRTYLALVQGIVQFDEGRIDSPLGRSRRDRKKISVRYIEGKRAVTRYEVLRRFEDFTMLSVTPETGRTHQIRVHLAGLGHPVVGDRTYGSVRGLDRQALHAKTLGFAHPVSKEFLAFESPVPADMQRLIEKGSLR